MPHPAPGENDLSDFVFPLPNLDADKDNADWAKATWDFPNIHSAEDFRAYLARVPMTVEEFKQLPVYRWNKEKVPWLKEL
ncbi:MAG: hypothetical protein KKI08_28160 [Armatimonadetes bacterium]|nr:hypothetical protein [Armatimonadota bacterium]